MVIQDLQHIYRVIPTNDAIEDFGTDGRWYSEKYKDYIYKFFGIFNYRVTYINERKYLVCLSSKLTPDVISEIRIKSPNINIEFIESKDINLESIILKLKEAANLALEYNHFDTLYDINVLLKDIDKTSVI